MKTRRAESVSVIGKIMYPTKEDILKTPFKIDKKTIETVNSWKNHYLKNLKKKTTAEKLLEISALLLVLTRDSNAKIELGDAYCYQPDSRTILLDINHASVISALHELGHHLYGNSELKACRFSVWLFKTYFLEFYEKLEWQGHLLVKEQK